MNMTLHNPYRSGRGVALLFLCMVCLSTNAYAQIQGINSVDNTSLPIGAGSAQSMWVTPPGNICPGCVGIGTSQPYSVCTTWPYLNWPGVSFLDVWGDISINGIPIIHANSNNNFNLQIGAGSIAPKGGWGGATIIGFNALQSADQGYAVTAFGANAMQSSQAGLNLAAAFGSGALQSNNGYASTAFGAGANAINSASWTASTSFGYKSLNSADGYSIVAIGAYAMEFNNHVDAWNAANTAIGAESLLNGMDGYNNVALGKRALLRNTAGRYNIGLGDNAFSIPGFVYSSTPTSPAHPLTGNTNVALGNNAGNTVGVGSDNILIGNNTDVPVDTAHFLNVDNVISATCAGTENTGINGIEVYDGSCSGLAPLVGIATQTPQNTLDVSGNVSIGFTNTTAPANGLIVAGNVGIGIDSPAPGYMLDVNGPIHSTAAFDSTSDARLKKDIAPIAYGLDTVMQLRPVGFKWKDHSHEWQRRHQIGLIAQEVEPVVPEVVSTANDPDHTKSIAYGSLVPVLIKATQELKRANDRLTIANDRLRKEAKTVKANNDALRDKLNNLKFAGTEK
jgi:Chaperone of endosialidase